MILRSPTEEENPAICHAGMDGRHPGVPDASGDIHVTWIPALHAGMTESRIPLQLTNRPPTRVFEGGHEEVYKPKHPNLRGGNFFRHVLHLRGMMLRKFAQAAQNS
jgi:hypothetical protein